MDALNPSGSIIPRSVSTWRDEWLWRLCKLLTRNKICKRWLFHIDMGNTALVQRIRCEPLGELLIHWTCAVFSIIAGKMNNVCIFSEEPSHTCHNCHTLQFNLELECDIIWTVTDIRRLIVKPTAEIVWIIPPSLPRDINDIENLLNESCLSNQCCILSVLRVET